jgi:hypothetical protein
LEKEMFSQGLSCNLHCTISGSLHYSISYQLCKHCVYIDQE